MPAELKGRITIDDSPANAALRRFESNARGHASRLDQLFAKTPGPERRFERLAGGITTGLTGVTSGPGALVGILGGLGRGLGLAGGAAAGLTVAAETLLKIRDREQETKQKSKELRTELEHFEHGVRFETSAEGVDKLSQSLEAGRKNARHLRDEFGQFSISRHPFLNAGREVGAAFGLTKSPEERQVEAQQRIGRNVVGQAKTRATILQSLRDELALITEETSGSEVTAKWEQTRLKYQKELIELRKRGFKDSELGDFTRRFAIERNAFRESTRHEAAQSGSRQSELYRGNVGSGQTVPQQNIANLRDRLSEVRKQQAAPQSDEDRRKLEEERLQIQNQIDQATLEASRLSPADRVAQDIQARRDKTDVDRLKRNKGLINVRRDMSGNVIGGSDPFTLQSVETPAMENFGHGMSWELSQHMQGPGHMTPFQGTKDFSRFFGADQAQGGSEVVGAIKGLQDALLKVWQ